ncbi:adenosylcobinamide-phosphate synthase CbiB [Gilvimarinus sp. DA14]|uniref:adenosylcobinamide-phosphate synthase CbiB n=1 Tax=Gilvimarinus sp. DA14 TaxID=2956798 RepID=UPI0020B6B9AA|nr:adenosylcobinamide-phosphate synthase CbiB [Gilvimarinus sp. DA14]UTF60101.1 adenosylcobinamide-phosphate synthase CbiB [Gilvimarinus sp. DA14]
MVVALALLLGFALDASFAEPRRWHPLVGFGYLAGRLDLAFNRGRFLRLRGALAVVVLLLPLTSLAALLWSWLIAQSAFAAVITGALGLYLALGGKSLILHIQPIINALSAADTAAARAAVQKIVSRDCAELESTQVARAATESLLENTSDAVVAPLFWFALAGLPGVIVYRLANTLDAMWGYRSEKYYYFGWAAARLDDLLNFIPARLCALAFVACGDASGAIKTWRLCAKAWASPNAGPVIASGAGALGISVGGGASYHGKWCDKPITPGRAASAEGLQQGLSLVRRASTCVLIVFALFCWGVYL